MKQYNHAHTSIVGKTYQRKEGKLSLHEIYVYARVHMNGVATDRIKVRIGTREIEMIDLVFLRDHELVVKPLKSSPIVERRHYVQA
jgi:hypothetical protein